MSMKGKKAGRRKSSKRSKTLSTRQVRYIVTDIMVSIQVAQFTSIKSKFECVAPKILPVAKSIPDIDDPFAIRNLNLAWSRKEVATLATLAEDPPYLHVLVPQHPPGPIDFEFLSRYFGRYSPGGTAVKSQWYMVLRLLKEAKREHRKQGRYLDIVVEAMNYLPNKQGTVFDIQRVLAERQEFSSFLDKYQSSGSRKTKRWKEAVRMCLEEEDDVFKVLGKTDTGKKVWALKNISL